MKIAYPQFIVWIVFVYSVRLKDEQKCWARKLDGSNQGLRHGHQEVAT
jgi:hypothetical protein